MNYPGLFPPVQDDRSAGRGLPLRGSAALHNSNERRNSGRIGVHLRAGYLTQGEQPP